MPHSLVEMVRRVFHRRQVPQAIVYRKRLPPLPSTNGKSENSVVMDKLKRGECPDCGTKEFITGPQGGISQNIECAGCGSDFNCAPFYEGWLGDPMFAERIGWNASGRWEAPGKLRAE